ncbi:MAG TPA: glycosyltransferase family 2 protein [Acidimicrobiia bacterium]|jgi:succinoglycan biosynthesis protein ExoA
MSSSPRVSVIIPAREAAATIADAVTSALAQQAVDEVVVAAADPATRSAVERIDDPRVRVVGNPEGTTPAALNRALRHSTGDIVVRCDAHSVLPPGYVARAVELLESTGAANVGGRQVPRGTAPFERAVAMAMVSPVGAGDARYRLGGRPGPTDTVYLGVFRRSELEAVGGFDETLERNQDYELNWRLRQKGGVVWFDPELAVEYRPRSSPKALWRQYFDYGYWKRIVLRRHPGSLRWRQLAAPALVVGLGVSAALALFDWRKAAMLPAVYAATTAGAGVADLVRRRDPAALLEPAALWVMHLAWGSGFIAGLLSGRR